MWLFGGVHKIWLFGASMKLVAFFRSIFHSHMSHVTITKLHIMLHFSDVFTTFCISLKLLFHSSISYTIDKRKKCTKNGCDLTYGQTPLPPCNSLSQISYPTLLERYARYGRPLRALRTTDWYLPIIHAFSVRYCHSSFCGAAQGVCNKDVSSFALFVRTLLQWKLVWIWRPNVSYVILSEIIWI